MAGDINPLLQTISDRLRNDGLMNIFQSLSKEQQVALMEWARSVTIRLGQYIETVSALEQSGGIGHVDLPVPKLYVELALKVGIIRAMATGNTELAQGCKEVYQEIMGDSKAKSLSEFERNVKLSLQLSKW